MKLNTPAASAGSKPLLGNRETWWKVRAVLTRETEELLNSSSQNGLVLHASPNLQPAGLSMAGGAVQSWSNLGLVSPSGCSPTDSGSRRTNSTTGSNRRIQTMAAKHIQACRQHRCVMRTWARTGKVAWLAGEAKAVSTDALPRLRTNHVATSVVAPRVRAPCHRGPR